MVRSVKRVRTPIMLIAFAVLFSLASHSAPARDYGSLKNRFNDSSATASLQAKPRKPVAGQQFRVKGRVRAKPPRQRIHLKRWTGAKWLKVAKTRSNKKGRFTARVQAPKAQSRTWFRAETKSGIRSKILRIRLKRPQTSPVRPPTNRSPSLSATPIPNQVVISPQPDNKPRNDSAPIDFRHEQLLAAGGYASCALDTNRRAWCWGTLGTTNYRQPTVVDTDGSYVSLAVSGNTACGLDDAGRVWCWQQASATANTNLIKVPGTHRFRQLVGGMGSTASFCGVDTQARAWCWGSGLATAQGETETEWTEPRRVAGNIAHISDLTVGDGHLCVLDAAGSAWCWGRNDAGQLGSGISDLGRAHYQPIQVADDHRFRELSAGGRHTCGITTAGAGWCWGSNESGELGSLATRANGCSGSNGEEDWFCAHSPVRVAVDQVFRNLDSGHRHSCATSVSSTTAVVCWGENLQDQLGHIDSPAPQFSPQPVPALPAAAHGVALGLQHSCSLHSAEIWCWGATGAGQLGRGQDTKGSPDRVVGGVAFRDKT